MKTLSRPQFENLEVMFNLKQIDVFFHSHEVLEQYVHYHIFLLYISSNENQGVLT